MTDDVETQADALANAGQGGAAPLGDAEHPTPTPGEDGTTLTGESDSSGDASTRRLVEPAPGYEEPE